MLCTINFIFYLKKARKYQSEQQKTKNGINTESDSIVWQIIKTLLANDQFHLGQSQRLA